VVKKRKNSINTNFTRSISFQYIILILTVFLLYGNTIFNKYSIDDQLVINKGSVIQKGIKALPEIFTSRYSQLGEKINYGYRPIVLSTFAIEYEIFGTNPYVSHTVNLLLYLVNCLLLFLILKRILVNFNNYMPIIIILLWAAHPIHTEVIASLKNRDELLSLAGALSSMYLFLKYADTNKFWLVLLGLFSYLFASFFKG